MNLPSIILSLILISGIAAAQGNSSGPNSPIVVGVITAVSKDEKTVSILQQGQYNREITIGQKTKVYFIGMPEKDREFEIGYHAKASLKGDQTKYLKVTQPIPDYESLGSDKIHLTIEEVLEKSDDDKDGGLSYVEMSRWIYHSPKHGPDSFEKADKSKDGLLDSEELAKVLNRVDWWKFSRKTAEEWFAESDANKDGALEISEFELINGGDGHIAQRFKRADKDRDQKLTPAETAQYIASQIGS